MEEQIIVEKIGLKFNSIEINRLKVSLYGQNDELFQICTLLQNRSHQIQLNAKLPYLYCVINTTKKTEDFGFEISTEQIDPENFLEREIEFDEFVFQIQLHTRKNVSGQVSNQSVQQLRDKANLELAKSNLLKIKQKVLFTLTKENFIKAHHKRKSKIFCKAKPRRSKSKKNLTAIFYRNQNYDLIAHTFKKQTQKSEVNIESEQKDSNNPAFALTQYPKKMNAPMSSFKLQKEQQKLEKVSFQAHEEVIPEKRELQTRITEKSQDQPQKKLFSRYRTGTSKNKYLRTLQKQTVKQLTAQKEQLEFLRGLTTSKTTPSIRLQVPKEVTAQNRTKEIISAYRVVKKAKVPAKPKKQLK